MTPLLNCIILKSRDEAASSNVVDRYVDYLKSLENSRLGRVVHVNPLRFERVNLEAIRSAIGEFLLAPTSTRTRVRFKSLIVTSRQTVECIEEALLGEIAIEANPAAKATITLSSSLDDLNDNKMIVYCVGDATLERFLKFVDRLERVNPGVGTARLLVRTPDQLPTAGLDEHKQNAKCLARLIEADYQRSLQFSTDRSSSVYAFYPCSSIRKDDLAKHLNDVGKYRFVKKTNRGQIF